MPTCTLISNLAFYVFRFIRADFYVNNTIGRLFNFTLFRFFFFYFIFIKFTLFNFLNTNLYNNFFLQLSTRTHLKQFSFKSIYFVAALLLNVYVCFFFIL